MNPIYQKVLDVKDELIRKGYTTQLYLSETTDFQQQRANGNTGINSKFDKIL